MTITLPPDLEASIAELAKRRGETAESFAIGSLREAVAHVSLEPTAADGSLYDALKPFIGIVSGDGCAHGRDTGRAFADLLVEDLERKRQRQ